MGSALKSKKRKKKKDLTRGIQQPNETQGRLGPNSKVLDIAVTMFTSNFQEAITIQETHSFRKSIFICTGTPGFHHYRPSITQFWGGWPGRSLPIPLTLFMCQVLHAQPNTKITLEYEKFTECSK